MSDSFSERKNFKNIGIWMSEKKSQKFNWKELKSVCESHHYNLIKLNLEKPLENQGRLDVFLHKLTDILAAADVGDTNATSIICRVEQYLSNHPNITVIDPLDNVRILLNRFDYYKILHDKLALKQGIFTPTFAELTTSNVEQNLEILKQRGVKFPVVCKPTVAHGSKSAHEMVVIFNEKDLYVCKPPCVVQSFVNHNAVLHKVFVIGCRYHICERPSLKNFYASENSDPIFYSTGEVCKADSQSTLSILDPHDKADRKNTINEEKIKHIIRVLKKEIGLNLAGFDVVIDNATGDHAVIDINVFPSYDNYPNFFEHLLDTIDEVRIGQSECYNSDKGNHVSEVGHKTSRLNGLINVGHSSYKCDIIGMNVN